MDTPKLVMVGVVGIGLYAAYRMTRSSKELPGPQGSPALPPGPVPGTEGLVMLSDPLSMKKGQYYRGRLELPESSLQPLPPFNNQGTDEDLGKALMALGFENVRVWSKSKDLPRGWPEGTVVNPNQGTRWFQGQWSQESIQLPRPGQIRLMWVIRNPNA